MTRTLFWIGLSAVVLAGVWLLLTYAPGPNDSLLVVVHFAAANPWEIGIHEDAFDYAGEDAHVVDGTANVRIDPNTLSVEIEIQAMLLNTLDVVLAPQSGGSVALLRMDQEQANEVWTDRVAHGQSGIGDTRLPETTMQYGGSGQMDLWIDDEQKPGDWHGVWSIGPALRKLDGSIRDQGLVFSPLLRDRTGFSDPQRTELTLLLFHSPDSDDVILHLVFPIIPRTKEDASA